MSALLHKRECEPLLSVEGVSRSFGAVQALADVSLEVAAGQVTALVGDNGAGKSTLVKIISGVLRPDSGHVMLEGNEVDFRGPLEARARGIESVYQDLALVPDLDVVANLFLGRELVNGALSLRRLRRKEMRERSRSAMAELGIDFPSIAAPLRYLSGGQRQAVAVARGVMWAEKVVLFDEPTAALGVAGRGTVLRLIKQVRSKGLAVLMVSHSLPEVFESADSIVVLRHGRRVATLDASRTNGNEVVALMTGLRSQ
jgi:simple sugar transport system ATP-binding protein